MSTGIKNGKLHTINIHQAILFFVFILATTIGFSIDKSQYARGWVIVIDPGHGGRDPGAIGSFSREKDINLAIALKTGEYIKQNIKNVTVIYTRKDDSTVDLRDRPKIANKASADLFISIHTNKTDSKRVVGAETYVMGTAKDQANLEVAMTENSVMLLEEDYSSKYKGFDPKSSESYIMFSLTQKVFQEQSTDLATKIQRQFRERVNRNDRDVKQAGFWVLYNTSMPSVLIETGFISNPTEEKYLNSKEGQDYLASSIFRACRDYLSEIDSKSGISFKKNEDSSETNDTVTAKNSPDSEITFMVQITSSVSRTELKPQNFKGMTNITEINGQDRFKYAAGRFTNYSDAVNYRKKIEAFYPDAFVVAVKDDKLLPLQQALEQKNEKPKDY
jgi:N-acetylmuramoyl-L-alanine amidase